MPYLRNFTHDVFVSYAHGPKQLDGYCGKREDFVSDWTKAFVDDLSSQLDVLLGTKDDARRAMIWMDPALGGNQPLSNSLKTAIENSALLLVVMSNFYLDSSWCGHELNWYAEKAPAGDRDRIFVVRAFNTDESRWPDMLRPDGNTLPGYPFQSSSEPDSFPLGWPQPDKSEKPYWDQLKRLAHEIASQLKRLQYVEDNAPNTALKSVPVGVGKSVFLGYMHDSLQDVRTQLRASLDKAGLQVLPPEPEDPVDEGSLRASLEQHAGRCSALVLVTNENCELWPKGQVGGPANLQLQIARARNLTVHMRIAVNDLSTVKNPSYRGFLADFQEKARQGPPLEIEWKGVDELVEYVRSRLDDGSTSDQPGAERFAVVCSNVRSGQARYEDFQRLVISTIQDDTDRGAILAPREASGQILLRPLEKTIANADSLVVVCFDQEWEWANKLILELKKLVGGCGDKIRLVVTGPVYNGKGEYFGPFKFKTVPGVGPDNVIDEKTVRDRIRLAFQTGV